MSVVLGLLILSYIAYRLYQHFFPTPNIDPCGKYVLISGCDSGFGHGLAIELDKKGFRVFAGVFVPNNVISLQNKLSSNATVFHLDITKQEDIDAAFELVKEKTLVLHGLVNNAGILLGTYIDWTSMDVMRRVMDVNYFGHVAMTKKFLPLLIAKCDSRVVNICSAAGFLSLSNMSAYSASKYAMESFSDCLRREMFPWGLRVSAVEPGFMQTPILKDLKSFQEISSTITSEAQERWGEDFLKNRLDAEKNSLFVKLAEDPMKVVRVLEHAVMNTSPNIRYRPGWQSNFFFPLSCLPASTVDWFLRKVTGISAVPHYVKKQQKD
ncbi:unnamed protein product [Rotaria sordida]|uniref:Uncharacterized protein n=1 Tax=Rotaria sordida TaxID=392033 RepID=A0A814RRB6_9BILA|nr:unnamed protein product [Rotaria sordida]CAF3806660.1 unnamed protein product [Rotaria sordida]